MKDYHGRVSGRRREYKIFILVCEGKKTEDIYFKSFRRRGCNLRIITIPDNKTDPENLVRLARKQISKWGIDFDYGDQIWCIFDADNNSNSSIANATKEATKSNIQIAFSNPCFELWYYLHYKYYQNRINSDKLIEKLDKCIPNCYQKNRDICSILEPNTAKAISNASKLNDYHNKNQIQLLSRLSNPSTQVFRLVDLILQNSVYES